MYGLFVARRIRWIFAEIGQANPEPMLRSLAVRFVYRFEGDTALGGERTSLGAMRRWWARLYSVFPGLEFEVREIFVRGWPWRTNVATYLRFVATLPSGQPYENDVVQVIEMRWGRVTHVHTIEDSLRCSRALALIADHGNPEATAAQILG